MITATNITVRAGGTRILEEVSLSVGQHELVAIIGANGAGKSTLVRTLSGDRIPDRGMVTIDGIAVTSTNARLLARRRAVLPQASALEFPFTVFDVALLGRAPHLSHRERPADLRIVLECLEAARVSHLRDRSYPTLSGGERQRVQLARALAQIWDVPSNRRALILDEPTASLDLGQQHTVLGLARRMADQGTAVAVVLHDVNLAARYADRIVVLVRGRVHASGTPRDVLTPDCLARAFEVRAAVLDHPEYDCPLVVSLGAEP